MTHPTSEIERTAQEVFDVIIVGSSPVLLIEALYLHSLGKSVAIFEGKTRLGGAWYTKSLWNLDNVEVGCHFIYKGKNSYAFLKKFMNIELEPSPREARLNSKGKECETLKNTDPTFKRTIRLFIESLLEDKLISFDLWEVYTSVTKRKVKLIFYSLIKLLKARPFMYPTKGCVAILDALKAKIETNSIKVFCGTSIDHMQVDDNNTLAVCRAGDRKYLSKNVITGQNMNIDLSVNGKPFSFDKELYGGPENIDEGYVHIVFLVAGEKKQPFSYIDLHRTDGVRRVQDVTKFSTFDASSSEFNLLICCHVLKLAFENVGGPAEILQHLVKIDLLKPGARMIDHYMDKYPTTGCIPNEALDKLEKTLPNALRIMRTWDLGIALDHYYHRWHGLIIP